MPSMRIGRVTRCAVVAGVLATLAVVNPAGPRAATGSCATHHGNWRTTTAPAGLTTFAHVAEDMGAVYLAIDPLDPNRMYASPDKKRVVRSLDGGCTWSTVFDLSALPGQSTDSFYNTAASQYRIYQLAVPHGLAASDGRTVYALADMPPPGSGLVRVYNGWPMLMAVSTDGGSTWRVPSPPRTPAMPFGAPSCSDTFPQAWLAPAPGRPGTVYFFCPQNGYDDLSAVPPVVGGSNVLYRSTDGGSSWSVRSINAVQLNFNGGLGPMLDVDAHNPSTLYAAQARQSPGHGLLTSFYVSRDGGTNFQPQFGGPGWDPDNVGFTALSAPSGPARLATFGQAGLCLSQDAGTHGVCWKPPLRNGAPGLVSGAVWSATGDKLFVTVGYDQDWQFTGCGVQRAGVLTVKRLRWHDLGVVPTGAPDAPGVTIATLTGDIHGAAPTMIAQPCLRTPGKSPGWAKAAAPAVLLRYAAAWAR